jgi:hypothetical protein
MSSPLFTLTAIGILTAACGSRSADILLEPPPALGGASGSEMGASGSANDGVGGAGGSAIGIGGSTAGGAGGAAMGRDGGLDASRDASLAVPLSPSEFGDRLALWLDGSFGLVRTDDGIISIWVDRTANGNDALATTRPPHRGLFPGSKTLGMVLFDGNSFLTIPDAPTLQWGTDDFTIEVVAAYSNEPAQTPQGRACLFEKMSQNPPFYGPTLTGNGALASSSASPVVSAVSSWLKVTGSGQGNVTGHTTGVNNSKFHIFGTRRFGIHTLEVRLDGTSDGINSDVVSADVSTPGQPVSIGGDPVTPDAIRDAMSGSIAEIIAVHGAITDVELARLEAYLKGKYRL